MPNSRNLSDLEEKTIVEYILDLDARSFPPRLSGVEEMANRLLAERDAPPVGKRWASNFVKRQPQLRTRFFQVIRGWFSLVKNIIAKYGIADADIYNFDETGFMMGVIASGMPGNREWVTVIQAINSQGESIPPYIIVAGQYHLSSWYTETSLPGDWAIATSENGWTTNERGIDWIRHFDIYTKPRTSGKYRLLVVDGHESHHSAAFELFCQENNIITLCMPAHSSHLLQPLDVGCFQPLKNAYGRQIENKMRRGTTYISKEDVTTRQMHLTDPLGRAATTGHMYLAVTEDFFAAFHEAFKQSFTRKNIQGGFRGAGLVPLNAESVLSKLDVKFRTPTPEEGVPQTPDPWISRTPSNPSEARSQSTFIKSRISRHRSSSPASIYSAVSKLARGTEGLGHRVALLESEVQILREENAILSRRRKAKKTRLQKGGSLTISTGEDIQSQREADTQLQEETRRSSGRKVRSETTHRRCGVCGNTGHNARTCQFIEETSEEQESE
ncbi:transposase [Colletotrichum truncatum]|uniref:Transposase n=1 Tax=Colletotrichum truncatum TaxID=5467 RepID=A0ACC3YV04_COLTU